MSNKKKLNLGCGDDIKKDYVNLDIISLPGVDVIHDLKKIPYPFKDNTFCEIICKNVLEHLPNTVEVMEELYRISKNKCKISIRVPFWNSNISYEDPTHIKGFHKKQFEFFDPSKEACKNRHYYSKARFHIERLDYFIYLGGWKQIQSPIFKRILEVISTYFCNIIHHIDLDLKVIK
jgi:SAM-dependent methyltransferase